MGSLVLTAGAVWAVAVWLNGSLSGAKLWVLGAKGTIEVTKASVVQGSFIVGNPSREAVSVETEPGCGCEQLEPVSFKLSPFSFKRVNFSVDLRNAPPGPQSKGLGLSCSNRSSKWQEPVLLSFHIQRKEL